MAASKTHCLSHLHLLFIVLVMLTLTGCEKAQKESAPNPGNTSASTLEKVRQTGELQVGYFIFEPTITETSDGKLQGVFIDMVESIGKALGAKVIYHKMDLANFAAGLQSRQFDLSIGATFATPQRAAAVAFTLPIFYAGYTGVVQPTDKGTYESWQDIDKPGLRVAVKQGSAIDDFVRTYFRKAEIVRLTGADLTLPLAAVSAGQADIGLMNQLTVFTYLREHPELNEILAQNPLVPTHFSWAVRQDDARWLNFLNTCIEYYINTGDLFHWESKYGIPLLHMEQHLVFSEASKPRYWGVPGSK